MKKKKLTKREIELVKAILEKRKCDIVTELEILKSKDIVVIGAKEVQDYVQEIDTILLKLSWALIKRMK